MFVHTPSPTGTTQQTIGSKHDFAQPELDQSAWGLHSAAPCCVCPYASTTDGKDVMCTVGPRSRSRGAQIGALPHIGSMGSIGLHPRQPSIANRPAVPMSGDNVIPGSLCDGPPHVHRDVVGPQFIGSYGTYYYEPGPGWSDSLTLGDFTTPNQFAFAQQSSVSCGYPQQQGFVWDSLAPSSQHGELAQPCTQPPVEAYLGDLAATDYGLQPEIPTSSQASPGHQAVSDQKRNKEKNRQAAAKSRKRIKQEKKDLLDKEAELCGKNERLKTTKLELEEERLLLTRELLQHGNCGNSDIERYIKSRANEVANTAVAAMPTTWISGRP
ncbi:hypothetical protein PG985_016204 [Apiospora marii]|uniref:uncharacterized protein n=1 Tax=Apiospora marii TaxID=335849 RepID=UPI00312F4011